MNTMIEKRHFFRIKAAMADLIDRSGGIERAAEHCGYSKSAVGRWHCRNNDDLMPMAAVHALECETGSHFVTAAMCAIHGISTSPGAGTGATFMGAYVAVTRDACDLSATVGEALTDGVLTPAEQNQIDAKLARLDNSTEAARCAVAAAAGQTLKVVA